MISYFYEFINDLPSKLQAEYKEIIGEMSKIGKQRLEEWEQEDVDKFLHGLNSISRSSITKQYKRFDKLKKWYEEKNNLSLNYLKNSYIYEEYINYDKLISQTIREDEIEYIVKNMVVIHQGREVNQRDKLLVQLAWEDLSSSEIENIRIQDIDPEEERVTLNLNKRIKDITDKSVIKTIKEVINVEDYYSSGRVTCKKYKKSEYLIKPAGSRTDTDSDRLSNLSVIFTNIRETRIKNLPLNENLNKSKRQLDLNEISLEGIRRSKIIWLLRDRRNTLNDIKNLLGKSQQNDIAWLSKAAKKIYGKSLLEDYDEFFLQEGIYSPNTKSKISEWRAYEKPNRTNKSNNSGWPRDRELAKGALELAGYHCEMDKNHKTFISKQTGKNFVEAHHIIPIQYQEFFNVSLDVTGNICSLCPTCHKILHYGRTKDKLPILKVLLEKKSNKLKKHKLNINIEKLQRLYL